jgi:hypothetical protein
VFVTANAFVRRDALERVDGFDERYRRAWREDTDLYFALLQAFPTPGAIAEASAALVLHPVREAPFGASIGQQANMAFDALLFKKYPGLYDRHIGFRRPPPAYAAIALSTLAALVALPFAPPLSGVFALLALAGVLRFAARRLRGVHRSPRQVADRLLSSFAIPYLSLYWRLVGAVRWRVAFY